MNSNPPAEDPLEQAVDEALEGQPRWEQWARFAESLAHREKMMQRDLDIETDTDERARLVVKLEEIREQIRALAEEAALSRFTEDALRFTWEMHKLEQ